MKKSKYRTVNLWSKCGLKIISLRLSCFTVTLRAAKATRFSKNMRDKRKSPLKDVMLAGQLSQENISYIANIIIGIIIAIIVIVIAKNTTAWIASLKPGKTYLNGQ